MYRLTKKSKWTIDGSVAMAASVIWASAGKGTLNLRDPDGLRVDFPYYYAGAGKSKGLDDIPDLKDDKIVKRLSQFSVALPFNLPNGGDIWMLESFSGEELTAEDISGACVIVEISLGAVAVSGSLSGMLLGIPYKKVPQELLLWATMQGLDRMSVDLLAKRYDFFKGSAKAVLWLGGINVGFSMSAGAALMGGYIGEARIIDVGEMKLQPPTIDQPAMRGSNTVKDNATVYLPDDILFDCGSADIMAGESKKLLRAKELIVARPNRRVVITGHTDRTEKHGQALSEKRAASVKYWLMGAGVNVVKAETQGRAATDPAASNSTAARRRQNRRVQIKILPN